MGIKISRGEYTQRLKNEDTEMVTAQVRNLIDGALKF